MNKIAFRIKSYEFANLSTYAETKINKQTIKSKNNKKLCIEKQIIRKMHCH